MSGLCADTGRQLAGDSWCPTDNHNDDDEGQNKNDDDANNDYDDENDDNDELQR